MYNILSDKHILLAVCSGLGLLAKKYKFSTSALLFAFIPHRITIEALTVQMTGLYTVDKLLDRHISPD